MSLRLWVVKLVENCPRCSGHASFVRGLDEEFEIPLHMARLLVLPETMWLRSVSKLSSGTFADGSRCCGHFSSHPRSF
ncbi:hypothetical protein Nepgr_006614 [Nepenthes gracilis]|uniref:Uncharacterized protein n=1 Tax=Nepenthes gracilis TaxID=150966 RepID=A0AAD3S5D8_NEPGR|nr:hypothetical protein Nepgr_006614 [Nepenthes gracilis]